MLLLAFRRWHRVAVAVAVAVALVVQQAELGRVGRARNFGT